MAEHISLDTFDNFPLEENRKQIFNQFVFSEFCCINVRTKNINIKLLCIQIHIIIIPRFLLWCSMRPAFAIFRYLIKRLWWWERNDRWNCNVYIDDGYDDDSGNKLSVSALDSLWLWKYTYIKLNCGVSQNIWWMKTYFKYVCSNRNLQTFRMVTEEKESRLYKRNEQHFPLSSRLSPSYLFGYSVE